MAKSNAFGRSSRSGHVAAAAAVLALAVSTTGCVYANVTTPLSYRAPTTQEARAETAKDVEGTACDHAVLGLIAWGDGGYAAAVADARTRSGAAQLADLRADTTFFNVLFFYSRVCTRVTGKAVL